MSRLLYRKRYYQSLCPVCGHYTSWHVMYVKSDQSVQLCEGYEITLNTYCECTYYFDCIVEED